MRESPYLKSILKHLHLVYGTIPSQEEHLARDLLAECKRHLVRKEYKEAYNLAKALYKLGNRPPEEVNHLFHSLLFAEDVITTHSVVLISEKSPYYKSLRQLSGELGFTVSAHNFSQGNWTKDYVISGGHQILTPAHEAKSYLDAGFMLKAKQNANLYYGALNLDEHHTSKRNVKSEAEWVSVSKEIIGKTKLLRQTIIEGGNLFCAINRSGKRFYLIGENSVSETMAYNDVDRKEAIAIIAKELDCPLDSLLVIPQWSYHLDLQMAYLGHGQFIIHSFTQSNIDFGLSADEKEKVELTFSLLEELFEKSIIDKTCDLLKENGFEVSKVFGCLFYVKDCSSPKHLAYVPYCKSSKGFTGALALMMNGVALDLAPEGERYFLTARCDQQSFRQQFQESLQKLGIKEVVSVDMKDAYDYDDDFQGVIYGVPAARSVTELAAYMNGALRCQTSVLSKNLLPLFSLKKNYFQFFKPAEITASSEASMLAAHEEIYSHPT